MYKRAKLCVRFPQIGGRIAEVVVEEPERLENYFC